MGVTDKTEHQLLEPEAHAVARGRVLACCAVGTCPAARGGSWPAVQLVHVLRSETALVHSKG